jgi:uncharacterized protein YbjT (DUF2867 family)
MTGPLVLVYCANGVQGRAIATGLLQCGCQVRALVRDDVRGAGLTAAGAEVYHADLDDPVALRGAHRDIEVAVLQIPSGNPPEAMRAQARCALGAVRASGVERVILNSSVHYPRRSDELPQFAARQEIEHEVCDSGLAVSVLRAPFLLSNLLLPWASRSIGSRGVLAYPVADTIPLCWAAPEDIASLAALTVLEQSYGQILHAGGRAAVQGDELAGAFSRALGWEIGYVPLDVDEFEKGVDAAVGPGVGKAVGAIFRFIERHPDDRSFVAQPFATPPGFPSFEPMTIVEWVTAHADAFSGFVQAGPQLQELR